MSTVRIHFLSANNCDNKLNISSSPTWHSKFKHINGTVNFTSKNLRMHINEQRLKIMRVERKARRFVWPAQLFKRMDGNLGECSITPQRFLKNSTAEANMSKRYAIAKMSNPRLVLLLR